MMRKVKFREPNKTWIGFFFRFLGFEIASYEYGFFHELGYSGKQKNENRDIAIIEKNDGNVVTVPNNKKYYKLI
jgi:hypothetical protein